MFARFKVTNSKQQPKKKILFTTRHFHPKISISKKKFKKEKIIEKKPENENNNIIPEKNEKLIEKKNIILPPKMPCNLFCILHNQPKIINHPPKKPEPLLKKKRLIDEETGNVIGRWTKEEHKKFIEAIIKFGNDWKEVQAYINTRTSTQARSHAQKFFEKIKKNKILKNFRALNIDYSDNFTNSTIMQLHNLYGNKTKNEINSVVNKFLSLEYDNPKKRRRVIHPYIGNKKNLLKKNLDIDENEENEEILEEGKNKEENNIPNKMSYIEEYYGYNNNNYNNYNQKSEDDYTNWYNNFMNKNENQIYKSDEVNYVLQKFVETLSQNCCDYEQIDPKQKHKRKNTLGFPEEDESIKYDDNIGFNNLMPNNTNINNNSNNQNIGVMTRSRKNSIESRKKFSAFDERRLSLDMNSELYFPNLFEDEKVLKKNEYFIKNEILEN